MENRKKLYLNIYLNFETGHFGVQIKKNLNFFLISMVYFLIPNFLNNHIKKIIIFMRFFCTGLN